MENRLNLTPKGVRTEARGLMADNWARALAILFATVSALVLFLLTNDFIVTLVSKAEQLSGAEQISLSTLSDYYDYFSGGKISLPHAVNLFLTLFYFLITAPLSLGSVSWYQALAQCADIQVSQIFYYYRANDRFLNAIRFQICRAVLHIFYGALTLAPSIVCFGFGIENADDANRSFLFRFAGVLLLIAGLIVYGLIMLRFFLAKYLFVSEKYSGIVDCFRKSSKYMKGSKGSMLRIIISFFPYLFLCLFIVPVVYVIPLFNATMAAAAQDIFDAKVR